MAKSVPKFPIIGGPLDGQHANQADFAPGYLDTYNRKNRPNLVRDRPAGKFYEFSRQYAGFNNAESRNHQGWSSRVWIHIDKLSPSIRVPQ